MLDSPPRLRRRGYDLGLSDKVTGYAESLPECWRKGKPFKFPDLASEYLREYEADIESAMRLYDQVLIEQNCDAFVDQLEQNSQLTDKFEYLGSSINQGSKQEIQTLFFDALDNGHVVAEDLWMKISRLSFFDGDQSLRFRFSFGEDFEQDVASDSFRQHYAANLAENIFPESHCLTENQQLLHSLATLLESRQLQFVERIVYFNAPDGGAYFHHDQERGHAAVIYAQLSGRTYWLALPRDQLCDQITGFINQCIDQDCWPGSVSRSMQQQLTALSRSIRDLVEALESFEHSPLIHLINETEAFTQRLIAAGHGLHLCPGDILLLPQATPESSCWHNVFCTGSDAGEGLSFALRVG